MKGQPMRYSDEALGFEVPAQQTVAVLYTLDPYDRCTASGD